MKLLIAVVSQNDCEYAVNELTKNHIRNVHIATSRSFFGMGTSTILVVCQDSDVESSLRVLHEAAGARKRPISSIEYDSASVSGNTTAGSFEEGGGAVFIVPVDEYVVL